MRILFVQGGFNGGGAEKIVAMLATHRAALGDEVHVAGAYCPPEGSFYPYPDSVTLHVMGMEGRGPVQYRRLRHIGGLIKSLKPDVVVSFLTKVNVIALIATLTSRVPVIISERNNPKAQGGRKFWTNLQDILGRRCQAMVFPTDDLLRDSVPALRNKGVVIANPCLPIADAPTGDLSGKRIVAVGRLTEQKGFDVLIKAMSSVVANHPDASLTIFGDGPDRSALEAQVAEQILGSVVSLPGKSERPGGWFFDADLLVASSRYEGFANVVAEAAVSKLPVVTTDCDYGPRETIRDGVNGSLVPVDDAKALADEISRVLSTPDVFPELHAAALAVRERLKPETILGAWDAEIDRAVR